MTTNTSNKSAIASAALGLVPPHIRNALLDDQDFVNEYDLEFEATISIRSSLTVQLIDLFDRARIVLTEGGASDLIDTEGHVWKLTNTASEGELPKLTLSSSQQRLVLPDFSVLSGDPSTRIRSLEESASDANLPDCAREKWRSILEERALEDGEVDTFHSDIRDTPVFVERRIRREITAGESSVSSLVPKSRRYFERLVGTYDGSDSIQAYSVCAGRKVFGQLAAWRPYEGFLLSLLLSSHSALTDEINVDYLDKEALGKAYDYLENYGDLLSQLGALEIGLRILPDRPEVGPSLVRLLHKIRDDDVAGEVSEFKLLSALFVIVDGELARTRLLATEPPFYRRLASLAQAALIHRLLVQSGVDYQQFTDWAISQRGEHYYMQTLADMRAEPRWNPDMVVAPQLQADFFGRIMNAGKIFQANLGKGELAEIIQGDGDQSLNKLCGTLRPYFPGPLEGADDSPSTIPDELAHIIEEQLENDEVDAASFIALINSAIIYRVTFGQAELAVKALRLCNYILAKLEDKSQLVNILNGLATVAAVSRNTALANEVRILVRRYHHDPEYGFSVEEAMRMCLVASAARKDFMEWREFAGEWLTELAFGNMNGNEGGVLHSHLSALLHSVPELWVSCAKADAALQAWCNH